MSRISQATGVATVVCIFGLAGCGSGREVVPEQASGAAPKPVAGTANQARVTFDPGSPQLARIHTELVASTMASIGNVSAPGKVEVNGNRLSRVVLPVTGRVTSVAVKLGDFVRQGQALLTVESADVDGAVSSFQQAQAAVAQSKSALAKARMDLDREKDLFDHGAVPQKEVLNAQAITTQAQASVEQAHAVLEQARRKLEILGVGAESFGQRLTIHAPIAGKVLELSVVEGEFRNDLSAPLMSIADLSSVWVTSDVPETAIRLIRPGEAVSIELAAYPGETFRGRVALIGDTVDPQTHTIKVRAELPNPGGRLKPEMFGNIQFAEQVEPRPTIPAAALFSSNSGTLVWREVSRGVFEKTPVTTGSQANGRVSILSGLNPQDRVVTDGVMLLASN